MSVKNRLTEMDFNIVEVCIIHFYLIYSTILAFAPPFLQRYFRSGGFPEHYYSFCAIAWVYILRCIQFVFLLLFNFIATFCFSIFLSPSLL